MIDLERLGIVEQFLGPDTHINSRKSQHHVFSTKPKAVDQGLADPGRSALQGDIIQIACGIRIGQMQGRRNKLVLHGECRADDLKRAAGRERMSQCRFKGANGDMIGMGSQ